MKTKTFLKIAIIGLFTLLSINSIAQSTDSLKNIKLTTLVFVYSDYFEFSEYTDFFNYTEDSVGIIKYNYIDTSNIWQVGLPDKDNWTEGNTPHYTDTISKVLITDTTNYYPKNNHSWFEIHIKKPDWTFQYNVGWMYMNFSFMFKCDTDTLQDSVFIEISFDGGLTFVNLLDTNSVLNANNGPSFVQITNNYFPFTQSNFTGIYGTNEWSIFNSDFSWDTAHRFDVDYSIIKVHFVSDSIESYKKGFMIDNLNVIVTENLVIGIENIYNSKYATLSPNPINEQSVLQFNNPENEYNTLEIINHLGQIIYKEKTENSYFEIGKITLCNGLYYYRLSNKQGLLKTDKFIKY